MKKISTTEKYNEFCKQNLFWKVHNRNIVRRCKELELEDALSLNFRGHIAPNMRHYNTQRHPFSCNIQHRDVISAAEESRRNQKWRRKLIEYPTHQQGHRTQYRCLKVRKRKICKGPIRDHTMGRGQI